MHDALSSAGDVCNLMILGGLYLSGVVFDGLVSTYMGWMR